MSSLSLLWLRRFLVLIALSLAIVAVRRERLAYFYFSPLTDLPGTILTAELTDPLPMAVGDQTTRTDIREVPTRLTVTLAEVPGVRFVVPLSEEPDSVRPSVAPGEKVVLKLPKRWKDVMVRDRALTLGLSRNSELVVDPLQYSYTDEFRTLFLGVGAAIGALIAGIG